MRQLTETLLQYNVQKKKKKKAIAHILFFQRPIILLKLCALMPLWRLWSPFFPHLCPLSGPDKDNSDAINPYINIIAAGHMLRLHPPPVTQS